jgi:drug/metabolite transporter (DMT)-like permease
MTQAVLGVAAVAALCSATAFGVASAVQHLQAGEVEQRGALDPRLLTSLIGRPIWLLGIAGDVVGVLLQLVALHYGPVPLVQALLVATLPVAVVASAVLRRVKVARHELCAVLLCCAGLVLLTPVAATHALGRSGSARAWVTAAAVLVLTTGALLVTARLRSALAPLAVAVAAGVTAGSSAVLLAVCARGVLHPWRLLATPAPYALVLVGAMALLLTQASFQTGGLAAPLAALTVSEPIVAVVLSTLVLHQHLSPAPMARVAGFVGAVASVTGVLLLERTRFALPAASLSARG